MRLFVAIHLDEAIVRALEEPVRHLRETRAAVRWVRPEGLHLTLKFLGETEARLIPALCAGLKRAADRVGPFEIAVAGLGTFPPGSRPRVIWADVRETTGALVRLHGEVEDALAGEGFAREKRRFSPHVTLGRVKGPINLGRLMTAATALGETWWGRQEVASVSLVSSRLVPAGAIYEEVEAFWLGSGGGGGRAERAG